MQKDINLVCSFCGKSQAEVKRLISSPSGDSFICDECVDVCKEIIKDLQNDRRGCFSQLIFGCIYIIINIVCKFK